MPTTSLDPVAPVDPAIARDAGTRSSALALALRAAEAFTIETEADFQLAASNAQRAKVVGDEAEARRFEITRPMDQAKQRVMDLFAPITTTAAKVVQVYKAKMLTYENAKRAEAAAAERKAREEAAEQQRLQRVEADRLRREADDKARQEREAAQAELAKAASAGDTAAAVSAAAKLDQVDDAHHAAHETAAELEAVQIAPLPIAVTVPRASGTSTRRVWKAEVTDKVALIKAAAAAAAAGNLSLCQFLDVDQAALNKFASATSNTIAVDGVNFYQDASVSLRTRGRS